MTLLEIKALNNIMGSKYPEQEYIVNRLFPAQSLSILSGASRSFKTYTLLEIAVCVASGKPLFGMYPAAKRSVLIIDEENGERLIQKRMNQLNEDSHLPIYFSCLQGFTLSESSISLVLEFCQAKGINFIIIDALIRIHNGDENSARDMSKVFKLMRRFTENGIAVVVTQHNRKQSRQEGASGDSMRGSSDILAAVDSHIAVVRKNKWYLKFEQTKQRYDEELEPFEVKVIVENGSFRFEHLGQLRTPRNNEDALRDAIVLALKNEGQKNQTDLLQHLKELRVTVNEHTLRNMLVKLQIEKVIPPPTRGKGKEMIYTHMKVNPND